MEAKMVTFIGGEGADDVGRTIWGTPTTGTVEFPLNRPVLIDPNAPGAPRAFLEHVLKKASKNAHFTVADVTGESPKAEAAKISKPDEHKAGRRGRRPAEPDEQAE